MMVCPNLRIQKYYKCKHILIVLKAVAALFGCGYGFFDFSLEKKIRKQ